MPARAGTAAFASTSNAARGDSFVRWRRAIASPTQERQCGPHREQSDQPERDDLGPEKGVVFVIDPAFRRENGAREANDNYEAGEYAVPKVDRRNTDDSGGIQAAAHDDEFGEQDAEQRKNEQVMKDRQYKVEVGHMGWVRGLTPQN